MSAASTACSPTRAQLVQLVKAALQKGPQFQKELQRRAAAGEGLVLRGVRFEADILREALACEDHPKKETVHQKPDECNEKAASESLKDGSRSEGCPPSAPSAVAQTASGARWTPPGGAARWTPGPVSDALLAARAAMECENAEPFCRSVRVIGGAKVGLLQKPEALGKPIDHLTDGHVVEVIARCHLQREGRVYLRLKSKAAWVCTRSRKIFSKIVLTGADTDELLEPAQCAEMEASEAMVLLPAVDVQGNAVPIEEDSSMLPTMASQASSAESAVFEDSQPMSQDVFEEPELEDMVEDHAETGEEEVDEDAHDDEVDGSETEKLEKQQATKRFRVVISSCPIMATPEIFRHGAKPVKMLKLNDEFNADGVFYSPAEHRAYLHLKDGRGWVCERARADMYRFAVKPLAPGERSHRKRKMPVSHRMAKVVAFRGGDTGGATKLTKENLMKNTRGKVVSKKKSMACKKAYHEGAAVFKWNAAVKKARDELGLQGFVAVKKGTPVYEKAKEIYSATQSNGTPKQ